MRTRTLRLSFALIATVAFSVVAHAQIPSGYYSSLQGKSGAELKTAIYNVIKDADVLDYGSGAGHTWSGFYTTDRLEDNSVVDRYSNETFYFTSTTSAVSGMNIEHSFPKSWWGGSKNQAYCDLYNLMPCEQKINSSKSNYPMGKVTTVKTTNGCTNIGTGSNGYSLWEPADKWKGDFARGYMYMATAYQNLTWSGTQALQILENNTWPTLQEWAYTLYLEWARADKPDELEVNRNEAVYKIQGNRNPYVDYPNLMEYVWGDSIGTAFNPTTSVKSTDTGGGVTPTPTEETIYDYTFTTDDGGCVSEVVTAPSKSFSVWARSSSYGWVGSAYKSGCYAAEEVLVTPEIDLTDYAKATLSFNHACNKGVAEPSTMYSVEVRCDGQNTAISGVKWPKGTTWTFNDSGDIDLSEYAGKKINICFRYTSTATDAGTWEIKWMKVTAKKNTTAINNVTTKRAAIDPSKPFKTYSIDGRQVNPDTHKGIMIIKQGGVVRKVVVK